LGVEPQLATLDHLVGRRVPAGRVHAPEQSRDSREQVRQRDVLRQVVVGPEAQARHRVELAVARGQEQDRQRRGQRAQLAAQREAAVDLVPEADVDHGEIGQARAAGRERARPVGVDRHLVALPAEHVRVVRPDGGVVLDDRDAAGHLASPPGI
jgi:hypothetical protein